MNKTALLFFILVAGMVFPLRSASILIPMDESQQNHLKSYGLAYWVLSQDVEIYWLLNYRGGSFMFSHNKTFENECLIRGISYQVIADVQAQSILQEIAGADVNMDAVKMEKAPKVADRKSVV